MNQTTDPRSFGFNYGPAWSGPLPTLYHAGERIAFQLRQQANKISQQAWALDMALRDVRFAGLDHEKPPALARLEVAMRPYLLPDLSNDR